MKMCCLLIYNIHLNILYILLLLTLLVFQLLRSKLPRPLHPENIEDVSVTLPVLKPLSPVRLVSPLQAQNILLI